MHDEQSNGRWARTITTSFLTLALLGCAPSVKDCHSILPITAEPVSLTTTPAGTHGCSCVSDGVLVIAEARRSGLSWVRGQLWVDGTPVREQDFSTSLAQAKAQRQVETAAAQAKGIADGVRDQVRKAGEALKDILHR